MINGEYGNTIRVSAQEDISLNINVLYLHIEDKNIPYLTITSGDGMQIGVVDQTLDGIDFIENQYVEYQFKQGDIRNSGNFHACLHSLTPAGQMKIIGPLNFTVGSC